MLNEGWREGCRDRQRGNEEVDGVCYSHVAAWLADSNDRESFDDCVGVEQDAFKEMFMHAIFMYAMQTRDAALRAL